VLLLMTMVMAYNYFGSYLLEVVIKEQPILGLQQNQGATAVSDNNAYEGFYSGKRTGSDHNRRQHMTWHYVDSTHNTTSAITYMHQFNVYRGNDNAKGRSVHDNNRGNITLMEILA
jgi:hypothetical protein